MRIFLALLTSVLLSINTFAQSEVKNEYPAWEQPVIKKLMAKDPSIMGFGVDGNDKYINIAILDKPSKILYWISCEGYIIEASGLSDNDYNYIISKKIDPFQLHQLLYQKDMRIMDNVIEKFRYPKDKFYSRTDPNYSYVSQIIHSKQYDTLKTPLQKLAALYRTRQHCDIRFIEMELGHPLKATSDSSYFNHLYKINRGRITVSIHTDSTGTAEFYNKDELCPIYKAVLNIPTAKLYFYHYNQSIFDSIPVNRKNILKLIDEGTDVFALYESYSFWQLATLDSMVKQLHDYDNNKNITRKQKDATEALLIGYKGYQEEFTQQLRKAKAIVVKKIDTLLGVDKNYIEQDLWKNISHSPTSIRYGQYVEGSGIVLSAPTQPYFEGYKTGVQRGNKLYQLADHRGNVMAVVTDKKIPHSSDGVHIDYYEADVVKATDYSSFGAPLPGRTFESKEYKYGFNGKENDKETGYQDYGMRMYDPNIGRFISVDPLTKKFPYYSPFQFAGNNPIKFIDLDGLEPAAPNTSDKKGNKIIHNVEYGTRKPYQISGGEDAFNKQPNLDAIGTNKKVGHGVIHDLLSEGSESAIQFHEYTNTNTAYTISDNTKMSDASMINLILGNYMWGQGYENWVFPEKSTQTSEIKGSNIVARALINMGHSLNSKIEYTADDQAENLFRYGTPLTMENFVGSANTYLKVNNDKSVSVSVFNITSITSGDILKHLPLFSWPISIVRDKPGFSADRGLTPWSNTSQTFNFTLNQNEAAQLISNYNNRMEEFRKFTGIITQPSGRDY